MYYELWSQASRNLLAGFDGEAEALRFVAEYVREHGRASGEDFLLGAIDEHDELAFSLQGKALVDRALATASPVPA